jgi:hypothetical protein
MSQVQPEYETLEDFASIATELQTKYPHIFVGDISKVKCVTITNKERPNAHKSLWDMVSVKNPIRLDCPYAYYAVLWLKDWSEMEKKFQRLLVADILLSIPAETDGKLNSFDLKDYATMIRTFGPDYLENDKSKDPIEDTVEWVCRD